jgi:hypothetical protein
METRNFSDFWSGIGKSFLIAALKAKIYFLITLPLLVIFFRWIQCNGWWGYTDPVKTDACVDMAYPFLYWTRILGDFPRVVLPGFIIVLLAILYLEWDKYKKDKPSGFGEYGRRTTPNGGWMRLNFERLTTGQAWDKYEDAHLEKINDTENHLFGNFTDQEIVAMTKAASKRFTNFLRKPTVETSKCIEWHIHASSGDEVKLRLENVAETRSSWVLTASFFEWAGRRKPAQLTQTHVTRFLGSNSVAIDASATSDL